MTIEEKWPFIGQGSCRIILLHDNAKRQVAETTKEIIFSLGWEILPHAVYSPNIMLSNYHLF